MIPVPALKLDHRILLFPDLLKVRPTKHQNHTLDGFHFFGVKNNQQTNIKASTKFSHPFSRWWQLKYFWMFTPKIGGLFHSLQFDGVATPFFNWVGLVQFNHQNCFFCISLFFVVVKPSALRLPATGGRQYHQEL